MAQDVVRTALLPSVAGDATVPGASARVRVLLSTASRCATDVCELAGLSLFSRTFCPFLQLCSLSLPAPPESGQAFGGQLPEAPAPTLSFPRSETGVAGALAGHRVLTKTGSSPLGHCRPPPRTPPSLVRLVFAN